MSYAILWAENGDPVRAGKLVVHFDRLVLEGGDGAASVRRELSFGSIRSIRVERGLGDRMDGRPVAVLETDGNAFRIASVAGGGELNELVGRVSGGLSHVRGNAVA
jgi:hypothetical protein